MPQAPTLPLKLLPKIIYPSSVIGGSPTTLQLLRQPRKVPFFSYEAVRHDNTASSGVRETVSERVDTFLEFEMELIFAGADIGNWNNFLQSALQGIPFDYYPDSTSSSFTTYYLDVTKMQAVYRSAGQYSIRGLKFYQYVPFP